MSKEKPYTQDQLRQWANEWIRQQPEHKLSSVDGIDPEILDGFARFAQHVLNAAFSAGAVTREEVIEPVAWMNERGNVATPFVLAQWSALKDPDGDFWQKKAAEYTVPLYAHPPLAAKVEPRDPKEGEAPWIPVGERLPEMNPDTGDSEEVLLAYPTRQEERPFEYSAGWVQYLRDGGHRFIPRGGKPTHWMPLPTPPPTPS